MKKSIANELIRDLSGTIKSYFSKFGLNKDTDEYPLTVKGVTNKVKKSTNLTIELMVREYEDGTNTLEYNFENQKWNDIDYGKNEKNEYINGSLILKD